MFFTYSTVRISCIAEIARDIRRDPQVITIDSLITPIRSGSDLSGNSIGNIFRIWSFSETFTKKNHR